MDSDVQRKVETLASREVRAEFIRWAFGLFGSRPSDDDCNRPVHVARYDGCYGPAGYVITVNGSPPRATVLIEPASGQVVAMRQDHVVRGSNYIGASLAARRRYAEALEWLRRFGLRIPRRGY
ncbi:MAG: hypothetical protein HZB38_15485 [Planctomycetes bacterium]|nr:hypothetical protein [Planctomycetota bacterium]